MVSDGETFHIFIPSKNQFLEGSTRLERAGKSPIENLRPQHILEAFFWSPLPAGSSVLFEELEQSPNRYYVLTALRNVGSRLEIDRKIWFDRTDLRVARIQTYGPGGRVDADVTYADWQAAGDAAAPSAQDKGVVFPRQVMIRRPQQDYSLTVNVTKLGLNTDISDDHFVLPQPAGSQLIRVGEDEPKGQTQR